jgi:hypothetical protein
MNEQFGEKVEQARNSLVDAMMHLQEVNTCMDKGDADDIFLKEDFETHISSLEELADILDEIQSRFE